jgi:MoxR-like ATPase
MRKVLVTITGIGAKDSGKYKISVGDTVSLEKEPGNSYDPDAVHVLTRGGESVGYVANSPTTVQIDCKSATQIKRLFNSTVEAKIVDTTQIQFKNGKVSNGYIAELILETKKDDKKGEIKMAEEYKVKLTGSVSLYPNKFKVAEQLKKGISPTVKLVNTGDKVVAYFDNGLCGYVDIRKQEGISTYDEIKDIVGDERIAKVVSQARQNYIAVFTVGENEVTKAKTDKSLKEAIDRIISEDILTSGQLDERMTYLKKNGVTEKQMMSLFNSYKKYEDDVATKIPQPKTLYQDSTGLVKKSIGYMNVQRNLLFEGDRGVGKNVLIETLAWLYNRPLFEFPMNSQHDNNSMLGGKTITSETTEDGKEKTTISFDPDVIVQAGEVGGILNIDEFNTSFGHVMSLLNSYLDDRKRITVPGYKTIELDPNTTVIATQNRDYQGTFENNEATVDRFVPVIFPPLESIEDILMAKIPGISYDIVKDCQMLFAGIKKCVEDGEISERTISIRGFIDACLVTEQDIPLKDALIDNIANRATDRDERNIIKLMIEDIKG